MKNQPAFPLGRYLVVFSVAVFIITLVSATLFAACLVIPGVVYSKRYVETFTPFPILQLLGFVLFLRASLIILPLWAVLTAASRNTRPLVRVAVLGLGVIATCLILGPAIWSHEDAREDFLAIAGAFCAVYVLGGFISATVADEGRRPVAESRSSCALRRF